MVEEYLLSEVDLSNCGLFVRELAEIAEFEEIEQWTSKPPFPYLGERAHNYLLARGNDKLRVLVSLFPGNPYCRFGRVYYEGQDPNISRLLKVVGKRTGINTSM